MDCVVKVVVRENSVTLPGEGGNSEMWPFELRRGILHKPPHVIVQKSTPPGNYTDVVVIYLNSKNEYTV